MAEKLMYIPNDDIQNYLFRRLKLVVEAFKHLKSQPIKIQKSPNLLSQWIRKRYHKTLGTGVLNSPLLPLSLLKNRELTL